MVQLICQWIVRWAEDMKFSTSFLGKHLASHFSECLFLKEERALSHPSGDRSVVLAHEFGILKDLGFMFFGGDVQERIADMAIGTGKFRPVLVEQQLSSVHVIGYLRHLVALAIRAQTLDPGLLKNFTISNVVEM